MRNIFTKKTFILIFLGLVLTGCEQMPFAQRSGRYPGTSMPPSTACYALESGVTAQVAAGGLRDPSTCTSQFDGKTYVRLRQEVRITNAKVNEGKGAHPNGDCGDTYYGGLREIGLTTDGRRAFWESQNYKKENLKDFLLIFKREEKKYHYFDVYIDQTKPIPDFVKNCEETGGLIPVIEGFVLPPQFFGLAERTSDEIPGEFDADCSIFSCLEVANREPAFDQYKNEFKPYYVKVSEVDECPTEAPSPKACPGGTVHIGKITATGTEGEKTYNVYYHADIMYLWESTEEGKVSVYNPTDGEPPKPTGRHPTLQLKALRFVSTAEWTWATPECLPVIYLYPEKKTKLSIKLDPDGYLTESQPLYENEWEDILAYPDGRIIYQGELFESLHYEAMINKFRTPKEGWVVKREDLPVFFNKLLPRLGLNKKENKDFQEYWLGRLTASPYFFVGLLSREEIERIEPVDFSAKPDTFIRVRFYFKDLDEPFKIAPPVLFPVPSRAGFTAVEWGGLYKQPD